MNEFQQNFFNACTSMAKASSNITPQEALDNAGLDGEFLLTEATSVVGQIPPEEHFAFGMLLGIYYEQLRNEVVKRGQ